MTRMFLCSLAFGILFCPAGLSQNVIPQVCNTDPTIRLAAGGPGHARPVHERSCNGIVSWVTSDAICILVPGQPPHILPFDRELAEAKRPIGVRGDDTIYLPKDVRAGDKVSTMYKDDGNRERCYRVSITRRPGGRVPPGYAGDVVVSRYHERMNAYQDLEEKGIPLPEKFAPKTNLPKLPTDGSPSKKGKMN